MTDFLPVNRPKRKARACYDRISVVYDWVTASESHYIKRGVQFLSVSQGEEIIEVGSGTGNGLALISEALAGQGKLVGVDLSRQMLLKSQKKTAGLDLARVLIQADAAQLPLESDETLKNL